MFIDRVVVRVKAGNGGSGIASFRREKFVPMGGPDGGDGGRGGNISVRGDDNLSTLLDYTYRDSWVAEDGEHGGGSNRSGKSGPDLVMPVPPGTIIRDLDTGEVLGEVVEAGQEIRIARGGRGGKGNSHFATATHQTPLEYQPGEDGESRAIELERKPHLRGGRHSRHHRRGARRKGTGPPVSAAHRAHQDSRFSDPSGFDGLAGRARSAAGRSDCLLRRSRSAPVLRRVHQDGSAGQ